MIRLHPCISCCIFLLGIIFSSGCQNSDSYTTSGASPVQFDAADDPSGIPQDKIAICVWPVVGLRREPGRKDYTSGPNPQANYLLPVYYGERVECIGNTDTVESENRVYMKIRLQDGEEGWVYEELFEKSGRLAVIVGESELYRRPDLMTLRDERLKIGEIVVVLEQKDGWIHVSGNKKAKKGWIREVSGFSFKQDDLKVALLLYKARQLSDPLEQKERLQHILDDESLAGSGLIEQVQAGITLIEQEISSPEREN